MYRKLILRGLCLLFALCFLSGSNKIALAQQKSHKESMLDTANFGAKRSLYEQQPSLRSWGEWSDKLPINRVSIFALLATPKNFANKKVVFFGRFHRVEGCTGGVKLKIYASLDDLNYGIDSNSIKLELNPSFQHQEEIEEGAMVEAVGIFRPTESETSTISLLDTSHNILHSASLKIALQNSKAAFKRELNN